MKLVKEQTELFKALQEIGYNSLKVSRELKMDRTAAWRSQAGLRELRLSEYVKLTALLKSKTGGRNV